MVLVSKSLIIDHYSLSNLLQVHSGMYNAQVFASNCFKKFFFPNNTIVVVVLLTVASPPL